MNRSSKIVWLSLFIALGLIVFMFESYIPRPLPWLKPGLANIASLLALYLFGFQSAMIVIILRVILGSLLLGSFLNPAFLLSMAGGISATLVMAFMLKYCSRFFSIVGISISGAVVHNIVQLILVMLFVVNQYTILYLMPVMILSSLFSGTVVAVISHFLIERLKSLHPVQPKAG